MFGNLCNRSPLLRGYQESTENQRCNPCNRRNLLLKGGGVTSFPVAAPW
jgi:hypothetical protein